MRYALRILGAAALGYAGYVHLHLAERYGGPSFAAAVRGELTTGDLFRAQFIASVVAAVLLLVPRRWTWLPAIAVAAASAAMAVASVYLTVGAIGPWPALPHEPWYAEKTYSALAEAAVVVLGIIALVGGPGRRRRGRQRRPGSNENMPEPLASA